MVVVFAYVAYNTFCEWGENITYITFTFLIIVVKIFSLTKILP
jgi:hypothetical protein